MIDLHTQLSSSFLMTKLTAELDYQLETKEDFIIGRFNAMASPCELLIDSKDLSLGQNLMSVAVNETRRIEAKFSRYKNDNLMHAINNSRGNPVFIDQETYQLLQFADTCYQLSEGMFDITSGVLRKIWKFDGSDNIPTATQVRQILPFIDWQKVVFTPTQIILPKGFELDLGGIGKEYAVSRVSNLMLSMAPNNSVLVNFGGDIQVSQVRKDKKAWQVGIENPTNAKGLAVVQIREGGLATSGDANRYLLKDNKRYSHILNPKTGYSIENAPRSVTVAGIDCIQSGILATLALLQGQQSETFLEAQGVTFWCYR
ncbi:FAD:protein FMN transferase [Glaciecola sp. 1036]|uniref:FAD:protein FMN transferase n=1 Tax=Alteromonadaceae TaxID=72275 RepID=UPI003D010942